MKAVVCKTWIKQIGLAGGLIALQLVAVGALGADAPIILGGKSDAEIQKEYCKSSRDKLNSAKKNVIQGCNTLIAKFTKVPQKTATTQPVSQAALLTSLNNQIKSGGVGRCEQILSECRATYPRTSTKACPFENQQAEADMLQSKLDKSEKRLKDIDSKADKAEKALEEAQEKYKDLEKDIDRRRKEATDTFNAATAAATETDNNFKTETQKKLDEANANVQKLTEELEKADTEGRQEVENACIARKNEIDLKCRETPDKLIAQIREARAGRDGYVSKKSTKQLWEGNQAGDQARWRKAYDFCYQRGGGGFEAKQKLQAECDLKRVQLDGVIKRMNNAIVAEFARATAIIKKAPQDEQIALAKYQKQIAEASTELKKIQVDEQKLNAEKNAKLLELQGKLVEARRRLAVEKAGVEESTEALEALEEDGVTPSAGGKDTSKLADEAKQLWDNVGELSTIEDLNAQVELYCDKASGGTAAGAAPAAAAPPTPTKPAEKIK